MQVLLQINKKLDLGWKMTNTSCPNCKGATLAEPKLQISQIYCPKEDKFYPLPEPESSDQQEQITKIQSKQQEDQQFYEQVYKQYKNDKQKDSSTLSLGHTFKDYNNDTQLFQKEYLKTLEKTNQISKKIGEKLVQGWTMLNQSCSTCLAPLMKSKKGEKICFGCNRDFNKPLVAVKPTKILQKLQQTNKDLIVQQNKLAIPIAISAQKSKEPLTSSIKSETNPQIKPTSQKPQNPTNIPSPNNTQTLAILNRIQQHSLLFLQKQLIKSTNQNDLFQVQRILSLVFKIKNQFK